VERQKIYYKGEGGDFPQVQAMVSLVNLSLLVALPNTKSVSTMHWSTCYLVLCKSLWVLKCLSFFLVPSWSSNMPLYPQSVTSQGVCRNSLLFHCFISDSPLSLSRSLGVRQTPSDALKPNIGHKQMVMHWSRKKNKKHLTIHSSWTKKTHTHNNAITLKKWIKTPSKALKLNKEQKHSKLPSSWLRNKNTWQCIQTEQII
jgi:hypothetical protein